MVLTIARIVILLFISTIMMLLAAHSTTAEARIKRTSFVYALVAGFLIASDGKLILGVIEAAIFLVMIAFSAISCLYAYAGIEIEQKKSADKELANEECTALVVVPLKKTEAEVTYKTVNMMVNLAFAIFCACLAALMVIRPTLLFPFYGKNPVLFIISLTIITINILIASAYGSASTRAAENMSSYDGEAICLIVIIALVIYGVIQMFAFVAYDTADDNAKKNVISGIPHYDIMLPISERYDYEEELRRPMNSHVTQADNSIYLIEDDYNHYYYINLSDSGIIFIADGKDDKKVSIRVMGYDGAYNSPLVIETEKTYVNIRGETKILETTYEIFVQDEEQILTY